MGLRTQLAHSITLSATALFEKRMSFQSITRNQIAAEECITRAMIGMQYGEDLGKPMGDWKMDLMQTAVEVTLAAMPMRYMCAKTSSHMIRTASASKDHLVAMINKEWRLGDTDKIERACEDALLRSNPAAFDEGVVQPIHAIRRELVRFHNICNSRDEVVGLCEREPERDVENETFLEMMAQDYDSEENGIIARCRCMVHYIYTLTNQVACLLAMCRFHNEDSDNLEFYKKWHKELNKFRTFQSMGDAAMQNVTAMRRLAPLMVRSMAAALDAVTKHVQVGLVCNLLESYSQDEIQEYLAHSQLS